ncbi:MAG: 30S ribosomal protein S12 methylthiotransferase RimO [Prevotella sp.]|nr:30S ribosomal protein S12 methylthiotransferase RimO [Prevotella sp.]
MGKTVDIITMGCSKNLVDSEMLMGLFEANGFKVTHDSPAPQGEIAVVNTCGFIADAKEESINTILEMVQRKNEGKLQRLYVMGCLSERYLADLEAEIPEVDGWYGKFNYKELIADLTNSGEDRTKCERPASSGVEDSKPYTLNCKLRKLTTPPHYAYLKISEGCDRHCAYCAIPLITGHHKSRPMEEILDEVRHLVKQGVKELQVIAQELTYYGIDLYGEQRLAQLVEQMADIEGVEWIRLHYAYPTHFPWDLLRVMREKNNVCRYLDIALQHISDNMLSRMKRNITRQETIELIERIRHEVPGIHLRTTLMVGFPGETEDDFNQLMEFTRWARFERMGAFAYSEEDGTYAAEHYTDDVPQDVKQRRLDRLMRLQQGISAEIQDAKVGQTLRVIFDRREGDYYVGRSEFCSPEVDPEVLVSAKEGKVNCGQLYNVTITEADEFDLYGTIMKSYEQ